MSVSSGSVRSLLELAEKATPGPWVVHGDGAGEEWVVQEEGPTLDYTNVYDIRLIAEMRNLVPALAQEWEAMRADNERLRAADELLVRAFDELDISDRTGGGDPYALLPVIHAYFVETGRLAALSAGVSPQPKEQP